MVQILPEDPKKRKRLAAIAVGIALLALLSSWGTGHLAARWLSLPDGVERGALAVSDGADGDLTSSKRTRRSSRAPSLRSFLRPIQARNIFDSSKVGAVTADDGGFADAGRKSDLDLTVLATLVTADPSTSSALIKGDDKGDRAYGYAIGSRVAADAEIIDIRPRRVILRRDDGTVEYITMEGEGEGKRPAGAGDEKEGEGVTKLSDTEFLVESWFFEQQLQNLDGLIGKVRAVPHKGDDGSVDGFRLSAIRRGSLLDKLGIKNGDVIHGVNGTPLTSTSGAMNAFQTLQAETNFSFDLTRRRKQTSMQYEIR